MYSQNDEERVIVEHFGDTKGRFLDIGAADGVTFSNTRRLHELGWTGTLVEPAPYQFMSLVENYSGSTGNDLVNIALADTTGLIDFWLSGDLVSTLDESHRNLWASTADFVPTTICAVSVSDFLQKFNGPYKCINLDVEGINYTLLKKLPLYALECDLICVEFEDKKTEIVKWMAEKYENTFKLVYTSSENMIFIRGV